MCSPWQMFPMSWILAIPVLLTACGSTAEKPEVPPGRETFASPEQAFSVLLAAARVDDDTRMQAIFGTENLELVGSDDVATRKLARAEFCAMADERTVLEPIADDEVEVILGEAAWPSPVPIVRVGDRWYFDSEAGIDEILNRRIGRNELEAIDLCRSYVDAQYIYRNRDWDRDGVREYAQVMQSTPGEFNGLYWEYDEAGTMPLCPLDGLITENEIYAAGREQSSPWFGYRMKILTRQGAGAPGGAMDYLDGDDMTGGFALLACPVEYMETGVMSFLVSHHGTVYEKDLGGDSYTLAAEIDAFDPSEGWKPVE